MIFTIDQILLQNLARRISWNTRIRKKKNEVLSVTFARFCCKTPQPLLTGSLNIPAARDAILGIRCCTFTSCVLLHMAETVFYPKPPITFP